MLSSLLTCYSFLEGHCHQGTLIGKNHATLQLHFCCSFLEIPIAAGLMGIEKGLQRWVCGSFGACYLNSPPQNRSALIVSDAILFWNYPSGQNLCWKSPQRQENAICSHNTLCHRIFSKRQANHFSLRAILLTKNYFRYVQVLFSKLSMTGFLWRC